jgi:P27 family predicted phage terminase small subunit
MGRRGPKPLPSALAKVRGTVTKSTRRIPGKEPKVRLGTPAMPASVRDDKIALDCWNRMRGHLLKLKVLTPADGAALEGMCIAYSRAYKADACVKARGIVQEKFDGSLAANPAVAMSRNAWSEVRRFAVEFGLTPSSRTRVREAPPGDDDETESEESPEDFLFRKGRIVGSIGR